MSVLVKGMKMPRDCYECKVWFECFDKKPPFNMIKSVCPLVEVKTPHGRLGDLDELKAKYKYGEADSEDEKLWMMNIRRAITNAPTVIEAEGVKHEQIHY